MKNAILSRLSSYSYTNGCNDALSDIPSQISSNLIAHDNSLCIYGDFPMVMELQLIRNTRKRSVEEDPDTIQKTNSSTPGLINSATDEGTEDKKRPMHFQEQLPKIQREKVPTVRRSQKLTDKITALQKLVSPYGKVAIDKLPLIAALELVTKVATIC
ncbi:hypothetical protein Pfo_029184 [Paulownia fortunei]|nr:hypothetical protein Pfo_029184 [Paulownia fortunei]